MSLWIFTIWYSVLMGSRFSRCISRILLIWVFCFYLIPDLKCVLYKHLKHLLFQNVGQLLLKLMYSCFNVSSLCGSSCGEIKGETVVWLSDGLTGWLWKAMFAVDVPFSAYGQFGLLCRRLVYSWAFLVPWLVSSFSGYTGLSSPPLDLKIPDCCVI